MCPKDNFIFCLLQKVFLSQDFLWDQSKLVKIITSYKYVILSEFTTIFEILYIRNLRKLTNT